MLAGISSPMPLCLLFPVISTEIFSPRHASRKSVEHTKVSMACDPQSVMIMSHSCSLLDA